MIPTSGAKSVAFRVRPNPLFTLKTARGRKRHCISVMIETFGTEKISRSQIAKLVGEHFDLRPGAFREELRLHRPIFQKTAAYGHFGRDDADFTWERTDRAQALRDAAGLGAEQGSPAVA